MSKIWILVRYVDGIRVGVVAAYEDYDMAHKDCERLDGIGHYDKYVINDVIFIRRHP